MKTISASSKHYAAAVATIIGTAVGAGMFGIPYVFSQVGAAIGTAYIVILGTITTITLIAYAAVVHKERTIYQLPGYAKKRLGIGWQIITIGSVFFGMYAALIAYTIEIGNFLHALLAGTVGGSKMFYGVLFWVIASGIVALGLSAVMRMESVLVIVLFIAIALLVVLSAGDVSTANLLTVDWAFIGTPYGVILFAFGALSAVPEVYRYLKRHKMTRKINSSILYAMIIVGLIFLVFSYTVLGVTGADTTESALLGLGAVVGQHILWLGALLGILTMGSSFLMTAMAMTAMYDHDFKLSLRMALLLTLLPPLLFFLFQIGSFISIISIAGALTGGFQGIVVWLLYKKVVVGTPYALRIPELIIWLFYAIFIGGIVYQLWELVHPLFA